MVLQELERRCTFGVTLERAACRRFEAELEKLAALGPIGGLCRVVGGGLDDEGRPYVEQAVVTRSRSLAERVAGTGPLGLDRAVAVVREVLAGLGELHARGLAHGAVRPAAVLTGPGGVTLVDPVPPVVALRMGAPAPAFAAPEVLRGDPPTAASDVFGAAATLLYLATGRVPWSDVGADGDTVLLRMMSAAPADLGGLLAAPERATAVRAALDLDPWERPTAVELATRLASGDTARSEPLRQVASLGMRYQLVGELGRGATGTVHRATCPDEPGRELAVKVLHEHLTDDPVVVARFLAERRSLTGIDHPNVVRVHGIVPDDQRLAIVMDLVDGPTLRRWMRTAPPLPPAAVCRMLTQLASALAAVHAAGVVHRDLKPDNVLLDNVGTADIRLRLTDFGIARSPALSAGLTEVGQRLGTRGYMAPEVVDGGGGSAGPAADVYAFGVIAYELLVGWHPFASLDADHADDGVAWWRAGAELLPERPDALPDDLWALLTACLARDPSSRPAATALARTLAHQAGHLGDNASPLPRLATPPLVRMPERVSGPASPSAAAPTTELGDDPLPTRPPHTDGAAAGRLRRRRIVVASAAAALLIGAAAGAVTVAGRDRDDETPSGPPVLRAVRLDTDGAPSEAGTIKLTFRRVAGATDYLVVADPNNEGGGTPVDAHPMQGASFVPIPAPADGERHCYIVVAMVPQDSASASSTTPSAIDSYCTPDP